eukprot:352496-Amphidinium_carterae.1
MDHGQSSNQRLFKQPSSESTIVLVGIARTCEWRPSVSVTPDVGTGSIAGHCQVAASIARLRLYFEAAGIRASHMLSDTARC